jgi:hypothetical protein
MVVATKSPTIGVVATIILLRNAGPLNIWLNYTWSLWVIHRRQRSTKHTSPLKLDTRAVEPIPHGAGPNNTKTPLSGEENFMDVDKMLVEYASNNTYGDLI